ncbi:hypothetical protein M9458_045871, partial [Cirrhinus mrigala]
PHVRQHSITLRRYRSGRLSRLPDQCTRMTEDDCGPTCCSIRTKRISLLIPEHLAFLSG